MAKSKTAISAKVRRQVWARSEGRCEMQVEGVCDGRATQIDHIKNRSQGGEGTLDNLQHGCNPCNQWKLDNPALAYERGLAKHFWE